MDGIKTSLCVCEEQNTDGAVWSLSFDGHNPGPENAFTMDKETAFRLKEKLAPLFPPVA